MPIAAFAGTQPERWGTLASYGAAVKPRPRSLRSIFVSFRRIRRNATVLHRIGVLSGARQDTRDALFCKPRFLA